MRWERVDESWAASFTVSHLSHTIRVPTQETRPAFLPSEHRREAWTPATPSLSPLTPLLLAQAQARVHMGCGARGQAE